MRILIFNWRCWLHPDAGGSEKYLYEIFKRLARKGYHITWFTSHAPGLKKNEYRDGIRLIRRGNKYTVYLWAFLHMLRCGREYDIVIDSENGIPFFTPIFFKKIICVVHHVHLDVFDIELKFPLNVIGKFLEGWAMPWLYKNCRFVTVSNSTRKEMIERLKINGNNIDIVYNGIDTVFFKHQTSGRCKTDIPRIIYFGRIKRYKRIDDVIKAFKEVKRTLDNVELVIAGKGDAEYLNYLKSLSRSNNLDIKFIEKVSDSEKISLLSTSWVYVTTTVKEGWGITIIEANACGTPVIAYNVPGLRDSVKHGYNGLLVESRNIKALANTIITLIKDNNLREKLSKNAIEWAKQFSWDKSAEEFEKILRSEGY